MKNLRDKERLLCSYRELATTNEETDKVILRIALRQLAERFLDETTDGDYTKEDIDGIVTTYVDQASKFVENERKPKTFVCEEDKDLRNWLTTMVEFNNGKSM